MRLCCCHLLLPCTVCEDGSAGACPRLQVKPLRKQLKVYKAWITGQRKDQSPGTRTEVPVVQVRTWNWVWNAYVCAG